MASPAGLSGQFGYKTETVVGTGVVVDKFLPINSEAIDTERTRIDSQAIQAGRLTTAQWGVGSTKVHGPVTAELSNKSIAPLLKHCFGTVVTAGAGPYTHTLTPGSLLGQSFTTQIGRPDITGTVQPFTLAGTKVNTWEISAQLDQFAMLNLDLIAMSETTATALAVASYTSGRAPFTFVQGSLTLASVAVATVRSVSLKGDNKLDFRLRMASATSQEILPTGMRDYTGTIETDFESLTAYNRFVNATETALVLAFSNGTDTLTFTCNVRYDGNTPNLDTLGFLGQQLPFRCVSGTSDAAAITAVLVNTDVTAV